MSRWDKKKIHARFYMGQNRNPSPLEHRAQDLSLSSMYSHHHLDPNTAADPRSLILQVRDVKLSQRHGIFMFERLRLACFV